MKTIDLNCDVGEGMSSDAQIFPLISSANIACGFHAGDESTIKKTIEYCIR
ncbi:LamB/YcsF family protein, partial [Umezakia ovalisporum]|uniref:LamB/YcsF family protein n=1 Tax=Umezakia ovalisporum TaxID=75695 RepID=UPI0039C73CCD